MADTGDKVQRKYANFRGVDFRGDECSFNRSPDSLNVWRNYKKLASIETRPGLKRFYGDPNGVKCMMWHTDQDYDETQDKYITVPRLYYIANDGYLYAVTEGGIQDAQICKVGENGKLFSFNGKLYAMGTEKYLNVTDETDVDPYVPTTSVKRNPAGGGEILEDVNLLSPYRINTFLGDGVITGQDSEGNNIIEGSTKFVFDTLDCDKPTFDSKGEITADDWIEVWVNGEKQTAGRIWVNDDWTTINIDYHYDYHPGDKNNPGYVEFYSDFIPPVPNTDGQDNVEIKFRKTVKGYKERILECTLVEEFDKRLFFSGNPNYPCFMYYCGLNDPSYFSDTDYCEDGKDGAPIRSMVAGNNALWVFRDTSTSSSVYYHVPTIDNDFGKLYPDSHSSISLGCAGRAVNFNDDIVFFSRRGAERASTDITTEQFVTHKSSLVDRKLTAHEKYKDMVIAEWEGYLLVFVDSSFYDDDGKKVSSTDVYLADSRAQVTNENHYEYEWFHWKLGKVVTCATVHDGVLYVGTESGHIYAFESDAEGDEYSGYDPNGDEWQKHMNINSYWTTPLDKFGAPNKLKTTNKKGCIVEATGDINVYAKVDGDTEFELIGSYEDITDYFASRIKRKKWKDIQLKFQSNTKFSLETATLEAFIGGYIKN